MSFRKWLSIGAPVGWVDLSLRTVNVAVVAFVALQLEEWWDSGALDTPATSFDAALIACVSLALNAILMRFIGRRPGLRVGDRRE